MLKIVLTMLFLVFYEVNGFNYCEVPFCKQLGVYHTVCTYQGCGIGSGCISASYIPVDKESAVYIVNKMNTLRNLVATGKDVRGGNSMAANMNALSYDKDLAFVAQCWANQCVDGHDICRSTERFEYVGQNVASSGDMGMDLKNWTSFAVQLWYDEIVNVNKQLIDQFVDSENLAKQGHFTQLVWARTKYVGCGRITYKSSLGKWTTIVCNFGPSGNILNEPVYMRGKPCSRCESGCNEYFSGLCGATEILGDISPDLTNSNNNHHHHNHKHSKSNKNELHLNIIFVSLIITKVVL